MSCSCFINSPCGYCERTYECLECGKLRHPDDYGLNFLENKGPYCDSCYEEIVTNLCICSISSLFSDGCKCGGA